MAKINPKILIDAVMPPLALLELGAMPTNKVEGFYELLHSVPDTKLVSVEVNGKAAEIINIKAHPNQRCYQEAIGRRTESRTVYITRDSMCTSLYMPNTRLIKQYKNLDAMTLESTLEVTTIGLDEFAAKESIGPIDFLKSDIQGGELDAFKGGRKVLENVLFVVAEAMFSPLYWDVPLFGDVCKELMGQGFQFYRFIGPCGRSLKKIVVNNDKNFPSCQLWADAIFVRDVTTWDSLSDTELLKLALLADVYGIADITGTCLLKYDARNKTGLFAQYEKQWNGG